MTGRPAAWLVGGQSWLGRRPPCCLALQVTSLETQLIEGLQENHVIHRHNADVGGTQHPPALLLPRHDPGTTPAHPQHNLLHRHQLPPTRT